MAENNVIILGDEVEEAQGTPTQRGRGGMRWTSVMSGFILRRMCQLISSGVRTDKPRGGALHGAHSGVCWCCLLLVTLFVYLQKLVTP
jgi:hypothetical protein